MQENTNNTTSSRNSESGIIQVTHLEKYCTDEINKAGKLGRSLPENHPTAVHAWGRMDAFSEVLMIIAREKFYAQKEDEDEEEIPSHIAQKEDMD